MSEAPGIGTIQAAMRISVLTSRNTEAQNAGSFLHCAGPCFCDIEQMMNGKSIHEAALDMAYSVWYNKNDLIVNQEGNTVPEKCSGFFKRTVIQ